MCFVGVYKRNVKPVQPSFEDLFVGKLAEPLFLCSAPSLFKSVAQPTFKKILAKTTPTPNTATEKKQRPQRPPKHKPHKIPIIIRRPALGSEPPPATAVSLDTEARPATPAPLAKSIYATPSAEEDKDFGALLTET